MVLKEVVWRRGFFLQAARISSNIGTLRRLSDLTSLRENRHTKEQLLQLEANVIKSPEANENLA